MIDLFEFLKMVFDNLLFFALHLSNSNAFAKPLSASKEAELLKRYKEKNDFQARAQLIEHNLRLVAHVIKKYYCNSAEQDDLISIGTIGLIKAVDSFDHTKGTRLATYAARCIENELLMHFRQAKKSAGVISLADPIDVDSEGNPLTLSDIIFENNTMIEDIDLSEKTKKLYSLVEKIDDEREKNIIIDRYGLYDKDALTQREIAKKLNISRSYVSRIEKKILEKLKSEFDES